MGETMNGLEGLYREEMLAQDLENAYNALELACEVLAAFDPRKDARGWERYFIECAEQGMGAKNET